MSEALQVEATGETVGEAKWSALRELEKLQPGIDKAAVRFQVVSEGERGLLGVGYSPARVIATVDPGAVVASPETPHDESELAAEVREILERILEAIGVRAHAEFREEDEIVVATKPIVVDAAGYRARRQASLDALAVRHAEQAVSSGSPVELEPMTAVERKVVHERLKEFPGVSTSSEGTEPNRYVVIVPE